MFSEDFSEFMDSGDFAVSAVYSGFLLTGILDREFVEVGGVESDKPVFMCAEADVDGIAHGDAITVNSTDYVVVGIQPDGAGLVTLILNEA